MNICLIGGSGFVGSHLIEKLKGNHALTIIDKEVIPEFRSFTIQGDIRDRNFLNEKLSGFDLVIHLAAEHKDNVAPTSLYYDVNVEGTKHILEAMDKNGISKIIFTSSVAIYGLDKENPDEDHPHNPFNDYGKSKWQAEEVLRDWFQRSSEEKVLSIVRPTVIFGEENRGNVYNLLNQIVSGRFLMIGKGDNKKSMAYVGNIVSFIEYLINNQDGYQVYNYADKPDLSTKELIRIIEESLSVKTPPIRMPYLLGLLGGYGFDLLAKLSGKTLPVSSVRVKKFCATTQFNASKAHSSGFNAPYTIQEGLAKTLLYEFGDNGLTESDLALEKVA